MDSHLQNKLQQFSAEPPEMVWEKIADALDANQNFSFRLHQYKEDPPVTTWNKIEKALPRVTPAKVASFTTRFRKTLRYAAAACFLAAVLVTITLTIKRTEAGAIEAGSNTTVPTNNTAVQKDRATINDEKKMSDSKASDHSIASAANDTGSNASIQSAVYSSFNEYVVFKDGDGKRRRVSKKLASLVRCGDSDVACQQRLQQLRQRMAAKAMTTDFTGILEMLRQLQ